MFTNINKSAFGATNTAPTFGFGASTTANPTPFGQTQFFGKPNTSGFGQSAPLFGSNPQQNTGTLFSNSAIPTFGTSAQQTGFGSGLFGQQQNVGVTGGTNGLFTSSASSTFGQQNKTSTFGFPSATTSLFGPQQPPNFPAGSSGGVFGSSSFGATAQTGTVIKFNPASGTDTMQKGGVTHSINTKHHCITCMKEYEAKSLEELRWEDYQANRRGPQQQSGFGATPFGAPASTAPSLFGQTDTKTVFGQSSGFGSNASGFNIPNQTAQPSLFGKTNTGFGSVPTTTFNFNSGTSGFGSSNITKGFGAQPTQNVFGSTATTQPSSGFGTGLFQNTAQNTGLFNKSSTQTPFSNQQSLFTFNQQPTTQSSLFQTPKSTSGFGGFGTSNITTPAFGQQNNLFSTPATQNPFNMQKPAQTTFGQPIQTGFGLGTQTGTNSFFGQNKPLLGGTTQSSFFNPPSTGFMLNPQQPVTNQSTGFDLQPTLDFHIHVEQIYDPFPHYSFLVNADKGKAHNTTDPKALKDILDQAPMPVTNIEKNTSKYRTLIKPKTNYPLSQPNCKFALLHDVMDKPSPNNTFSFKNISGKQLVLRKSISKIDKDNLEEYKRMSDTDDTKKKSLFKNLQQLSDVTSEMVNVVEEPKPISQTEPHLLELPVFHTNDEHGGGDTPVRDKFNKPKAKHLSLRDNSYLDSTDPDVCTTPKLSERSKTFSPDVEPKHSILRHDDTYKGKQNKSVSFQDSEISSSTKDASTNTLTDEDKSEDKENIDNSKIPSHLTCGVKLVHPEYYTKPPLNELYKHKNEKGECIIKGFIIGRTGYGSIYFPDSIDIANLDLDEIVVFRYREITVYPDDSKKPPFGQGLNRRAQVTLENVWPRDKITHELVRDVKEISKSNFIDRLCLLAERQNASFLDYRPDTGSWLFTVEHFSKYLFSDVGDSECYNILNENKKTQNKLQDLETDEIMEEEEDEFTNRGLGGIRKIEVSDFGSSPLFNNFSHPLDITSLKDEAKPVFISKSSFFDEDSLSDDVSSCDIDVHLSLQNSTTTTSSESDRENLIASDGFIKHYTLLPEIGILMPSLEYLSDSQTTVMNITSFKRRSFKVGWGHGLKLVTLQHKLNTINLSDDSNCVVIVDIVKDVRGKPEVMNLEDHLRATLNLCTFATDSSRLPLCNIQGGWKALVHQTIANEFLNKSSNALTQYYSKTWDLCWALWGPEAVTPVAKRELFSDWLESIIKPYFDNLESLFGKPISVQKRLFMHLLSHQVSEASQLAMTHNMPILSVLIAQTQQSTRDYLRAQIELWEEKGSIQFMNFHLKKLYTLIGGLPLITDVNIFEGLEWKRILALYLWYICPPGVPLDNAVREYTDAFEDKQIAKDPSAEYSLSMTEVAYDAQFHILQLNHTPQHELNKILNPASHTKYTSDYRFSWLLLQVFIALKIGNLPDATRNAIHIHFANQLEEMGLWKWSIFVLLFVTEKRLKFKYFMSVLERNWESDTDPEIQTFFINDLKIPTHLLHKALALKTKSLNQYTVSFAHNLFSNNWWEAHEQAILHVIPELFLNRQFKVLYDLLHKLFSHSKAVVYENAIGSMVYDFLQVHNIMIRITENETSEEQISYIKIEMRTKLFSISNKIKNFPIVTKEQSVAVAELSKYLNLIYALCYESGQFSKMSLNIEEFMPSDYRFVEHQ